MKQYKVTIPRRTWRLIENHVRFVAQVNERAAYNTKERLLRAIDSLKERPKSHPYLEWDGFPQEKYRKLVVPKWYILLYTVENDTVHIDYVLDCRQDNLRIIEKFENKP